MEPKKPFLLRYWQPIAFVLSLTFGGGAYEGFGFISDVYYEKGKNEATMDCYKQLQEKDAKYEEALDNAIILKSELDGCSPSNGG